ncbi:MAG: hypothetical protein CVU69_03075 [Deltaproteobacteria bacterium HGW-Deltaproteobacteria-4]|nr:MAG: hypothetical protein CVU69_03075 [Deltaproteobacteria bacterium HGW-Deltaproteobacteria-4]
MKNPERICRKFILVLCVSVALLMILVSQSSAMDKKDIYFKVFQGADLVPRENNEVIVSCDSYDDHTVRDIGAEVYPDDGSFPQQDMIFGVSVLCPKSQDRLDPVIHIYGNQSDLWEWTDPTDGLLDFHLAIVYCENKEFNFTAPASRVILECLDHDVITDQVKTTGKKQR